MRKATIELNWQQGTVQASFDGLEWTSEDPVTARICTRAMDFLPFAYHPDRVNGIAKAVADYFGGKVITEAPKGPENHDPNAIY